MKPAEVKELMKLKGWSPTKLAAELDVTENTVFGWLSGRRNPSGPACILMRQWIALVKDEQEKNGKLAAAK